MKLVVIIFILIIIAEVITIVAYAIYALFNFLEVSTVQVQLSVIQLTLVAMAIAMFIK